ncbi:MAG: cysteine hydrolase [Clostridia bacterium]|nr:cysteine hydrolase [Clostridia bacterium]
MQKLLIVVDMQNDFIDGALGTKEAEAIVSGVAEQIRSFDGAVLATLDTHEENYMNTAEGAKLPIAHCIRGTTGWELHPQVQEALDEKKGETLEKPTFGSVQLPVWIRDRFNPDELEITLVGLCTDICVVSKALLLKAHFPETPIAVTSSLCAGVTPDAHQAALSTMRSCQIDVL